MFLAQNCIKRHFKYLLFPPQKVGPVYAPIRHTGCLENFLPKSRVYPQMEKIEGCAWWVHILGLWSWENKLPYHISMLYKYYWLIPSQTKVMHFWNWVRKRRFSGAFPSKSCILQQKQSREFLGSGTHFRGVIKFVLGVLYSKYGYSEGGRGRLKGFWGRRTPKSICTQQA